MCAVCCAFVNENMGWKWNINGIFFSSLFLMIFTIGKHQAPNTQNKKHINMKSTLLCDSTPYERQTVCLMQSVVCVAFCILYPVQVHGTQFNKLLCKLCNKKTTIWCVAERDGSRKLWPRWETITGNSPKHEL